MTAWGVVAVCAIGGGVAGPLLEQVARRVPRPVAADGSGTAGSGGGGEAFAGIGVVCVVCVVTAAAFGLAAVRLGAVPSLAAYCALFGTLVAVSVTDLRTGLVPRRLLYPGLALVAVGLVASSADAGAWKPFFDAAVGGAIAFVVFYVIWWVYPKGLGFGDVRLAGLCGASLGYLGFEQLYLGFLAAFLLGALAGVVVLARKGARRFPFAPALAAGTAFGVLWGGWLGNLWLHPG